MTSLYIETTGRSLLQYLIRCLIVRSREVSKPWLLCLELTDHSEIWQAPRQQCCRGACQISEWYDISNYQSCGFESSLDLMTRRLIGYWNGPNCRLSNTKVVRMPTCLHQWHWTLFWGWPVITKLVWWWHQWHWRLSWAWPVMTKLASWWHQDFHTGNMEVS